MRVWPCWRWRSTARTTPPLRIREISESHGIPERYLVQILLQLKGAGLVASTRGASGGYRLARPAAEISPERGPDRDRRPRRRRLARAPRATGRGSRVLATVWERVRAAERGVLDRTTIAELVAQASPREWTI